MTSASATTFLDTDDGARIAYHRRGDGPALLATHGFAASSHMYEHMASQLAPTNTVITWDVRGHGATDAGTRPEGYTADLAVADMAAILDDCGFDQAVVAGHSMGGFLSLRFYLAHPDRVRALVLIGSGPGFRKDDARAGWNDMCASMARGLDKRGLDGYRGGDEYSAGAHIHGAAKLALAARGILTQHDAQVIDALASIEVPTLVVVGERDEQFMAGSQYTADRLPGASLAMIPDAGHAPMISHPEPFERALGEFLHGLQTT